MTDTDINAWLEKVERKLRGSGARANISLHDSSLLVTRLRAALKVVEAAEPIIDWLGNQLREPSTVTARNVEKTLTAFHALCEKEGRDGDSR